MYRNRTAARGRAGRRDDPHGDGPDLRHDPGAARCRGHQVEPPAGDKTRSLGGMGTSFFPAVQPRQSSVVLDFAKAEDRDHARLLRRRCGSWKISATASSKNRGSGRDELRQKYPHLIVAGHKGFLSGPYKHRPALD